jgi:hypothetical protein
MRRFRSLVLVAAFVLFPSLAHAGWLDWINRLSGPGPFVGVGEDFDVLCIDANGNLVPGCFGVVLFRPTGPGVTAIEQLPHVISVRAEKYWSVGSERFTDLEGTPFSDTRGVSLTRFVGLYQRRVSSALQFGPGMGFVRVSGDGFNTVNRAVLVPASVTWGPFDHSSSKLAKPWRVVVDASVILKGFKGSDFNNNVTTFDTHGSEWRLTAKFAYDLRHLP